MSLENDGEETASVTIVDNAYRQKAVKRIVNPGQEIAVVLDLGASHGWYDVTVNTENVAAHARFAGRVETGRPSISDPFMGE